jgi:glyoxylase-like metal-dependent hydrolase (beta-lactamase superfamily II)
LRIQILNGVSMSPWWPRWHLGGVCLLIESDQGLVLVDTGLGLQDYAHPSRSVRFFMADFGVHRDQDQAVVRQLTSLGCKGEDVRHIVMTHLHFDHAGGLRDFPNAKVHLHKREYDAFRSRRVHRWADLGYNHAVLDYQPELVLHAETTGKWFDFAAIRLPFEPEIWMVPLFGHSDGHCGVAIRDGSGWLFHAADAVPTNAEFDILPDWLYRLVIGPHVPRLKAFAECHPEVRLLAGHMGLDWFKKEGRK